MNNPNDRRSVHISVLLAFYIAWSKMPILQYYINTYIALALFVLLGVFLVFKDYSPFQKLSTVLLAYVLFCGLFFLDTILGPFNFSFGIWHVFRTVFPLVLGITLIKNKAYSDLVIKVIIVVSIITAMTTCFGLQSYPNASRLMATGKASVFYKKINIGDYYFIYMLPLIHPMIICVYKTKRKLLISIVISALFGWCVLQSEYAIAIVLFAVSCITYIFPVNRNTHTFRGGMLALVAVLVVVYIVADDILLWLANQNALESFSEKFKDIASILRGNDVEGISAQGRIKVYKKSLNLFLQNPLWGKGLFHDDNTGGHSFVFDIMANWGIIGLSVIIFMYREILKNYKTIAKDSYVMPFLVLSFCLSVLLSVLNPQIWTFEMVFVIPSCAIYVIGNGQEKRPAI